MAKDFSWQKIREDLESLNQVDLSSENLVDYIRRLDDLEAAVYQESSSLLRNFYTQPESIEAHSAYSNFSQTIMAESATLVKSCAIRLNPFKDDLPKVWRSTLLPFMHMNADAGAAAELAGIDGAAQEFNAFGTQIVYEYPDGQGDLLADRAHPDQEVREKAYRGLVGCMESARTAQAKLFIQLFVRRQRVARSSGETNFLSLAWKTEPLTERDYTPADVARLRNGIRRYISPLLIRLNGTRRTFFKIEHFRPWDADLSIDGKSRLSVIESADDAIQAVESVLTDISPKLADVFRQLREEDVFSVVGEGAPFRQAYTDYLPKDELPWVSLWYNRSSTMVFALIHEVGHAIHLKSVPKDALFRQHFPSKEYTEFIAQSTEAMSLDYINHFFSQEDVPAVRLKFFERVLGSMVRMCMLDEFQERVYQLDEIDLDTLDRMYIDLLKEYPTGIDFEEIGELVKRDWVTWHVIVRPFYNMEYVIAWVAALQSLNLSPEKRALILEKGSSRAQDDETTRLFSDLNLAMLPTAGILDNLSKFLTEAIDADLNILKPSDTM